MSATASVAAAATIVKLTVALPKAAVDAITNLATAQGKTKTQVLREAIALKVYVERELAEPDTRFLIQRGGDTRELVFTEAF